MAAVPRVPDAARRAGPAVAVFVGVVLATVLFSVALPDDLARNESTDYDQHYAPVAERLLDGEGLTEADGTAALRYPPGFSIALAGTFAGADLVGAPHDGAARTLAVLCVGISGVLLWWVAGRVFDRRVALVAVALWALHPVDLWLAKQPNSELPFTVLLLGALATFVPVLTTPDRSRPRLAAVGALLAAATLVRPAGLLLVVPFAALAWTATRAGGAEPADTARGWRARAADSGVLLLAFAALVAPWTAWASTQAGRPVLLADAVGVNVVEGLSLGIDEPADLDQLGAPAGARRVALDALALEQDEASDAEVRRFVVDAARERPGDLAQLLAVKAARSWYGSEAGRWEGLVALAQAALAAAAVLGGVLAARAGPGRRRYAALVAGLLAAAWLTTIAVHSLLRHLVPTLALAFPLVALALVVGYERLRPRATVAGATGAGATAADRPAVPPPDDPKPASP